VFAKEGRQRLEDSADLLNRQAGAFLRPIERTALLIQVTLDRLLNGLERAGINLGILPGEELNGPLIDQFFGGQRPAFPGLRVSRANY
jgi:hypothetical protein